MWCLFLGAVLSADLKFVCNYGQPSCVTPVMHLRREVCNTSIPNFGDPKYSLGCLQVFYLVDRSVVSTQWCSALSCRLPGSEMAQHRRRGHRFGTVELD